MPQKRYGRLSRLDVNSYTHSNTPLMSREHQSFGLIFLLKKRTVWINGAALSKQNIPIDI